MIRINSGENDKLFEFEEVQYRKGLYEPYYVTEADGLLVKLGIRDIHSKETLVSPHKGSEYSVDGATYGDSTGELSILVSDLSSVLGFNEGGGGIGVETDPIFMASAASGLTTQGRDFANSNPSLTLDATTARGNYTSRPITFLDGINAAYGQISIKPATFSFFWGDMNPAHTGIYNHSFGYGALRSVTTGDNNIAFGAFASRLLTTGRLNTVVGITAGENATTGNSNVIIGEEAANKITTGYKNTYLGTAAGYSNTTGNLNTLIGYKVSNTTVLGDKNVMIGSFSGQGVSGTNNVIIGTAAGLNDGAINNRLIIHSNTTLNGYTNDPLQEGVVGQPTQGNVNNALVVGAFDQRWLRLNGYFTINPSTMPNAQGDVTYTKRMVMRPSDGVVGWEDKVTVVTDVCTLGSGISGEANVRKTNNVVELVATLQIPENYSTETPLFTLPTGFGITSTFMDSLILPALATAGTTGNLPQTIFIQGNNAFYMPTPPTGGLSLTVYTQYNIL